jgi:hypothetical protein
MLAQANVSLFKPPKQPSVLRCVVSHAACWSQLETIADQPDAEAAVQQQHAQQNDKT